MKKGFTLFELLLVITLMGVLVVVVLPKYVTISTKAEQTERDGIVAAVRSGLDKYRADQIVEKGSPGEYPAALDDLDDSTDCSPMKPCFTKVLTLGVTDNSWHKNSDSQYVFSDGVDTFIYNYDSKKGIFTSTMAP